MKRIPFNEDWIFGEGPMPFFMFPQGGSGENVTLPHDYIINKERDPACRGNAATGFFPDGQGFYTKEFALPEEWREKAVWLDVDGAYMNSEVFLNGNKLYHHPYGYTPYQVELTDHLYSDITNSLRISTQCFQPSTRWYSGGGLYREVSLLVGGRQYIHPWDVFITTPEVTQDKASVSVALEITNAEVRVSTANVALTVISEDGAPVATAEENVSLTPQGKTPVSLCMTVVQPLLWDTETPHRYTLRMEVRVGDAVIDSTEAFFGIRHIEIDAKNGFRLNGKKMKLRGGCIHHDNSLLGACAFPRAEERKIEILKSAGYNAIRSAHNPPSSALLDACDRLGMLVIDESFDAWRTQKNSLDYHLYFEDWWQRDTRAMVLRDRNRPSIYCWSIGNEIPEMLGVSDGARFAKLQADYVRSLDSTRPVTAAANGFVLDPPGKPRKRRDFMLELVGKPVLGLPVNGEDPWGEQTLEASKALDIFGYNYMYGRYAYDAQKFPERVIHATETHSYHTYDYWQAVLENDNCIGDFIWTAFDNLGEAGAGRPIYGTDNVGGFLGDYPWLSCWQGDHDLSGNRRPQSYYRKIMWGLDDGIHLFTLHPSLNGKTLYGKGWHWEDVKPNWTFEESWLGTPVKVEAYADCDEVEFLLNGECVGKVCPQELKAICEIPYAPGTLEAVAWRQGERIACAMLQTTGAPAQLAVFADRPVVCADAMDLCYIAIEVRDAAGRRVVDMPVEVSVTVEGAGTLAGLGSANPCTEENYGTGKRFTFDGRALACIRAGKVAGDIRVAVCADGLQGEKITVVCGEKEK